MKSRIILSVIIIFSNLFMYSQPRTGRKSIPIRSYCNGKLFLLKYKYDNDVNYYYLTEAKTNYNRSINTIENNRSIRNLIFISKNDTMRLNIVYPPRDNLGLEIKNLNFLKGDYDIDLYHYMQDKAKKMFEIKLPFIIENFPDDCMNYKIEKNKL